MGIGGGIALIVIGAILSFGVSDAIDGVNLTVIGYICMGAGVIALILAIVLNAQRSNTSHTAVVEQRTTPNAPPAQAAPVAARPAGAAGAARPASSSRRQPPGRLTEHGRERPLPTEGAFLMPPRASGLQRAAHDRVAGVRGVAVELLLRHVDHGELVEVEAGRQVEPAGRPRRGCPG